MVHGLACLMLTYHLMQEGRVQDAEAAFKRVERLPAEAGAAAHALRIRAHMWQVVTVISVDAEMLSPLCGLQGLLLGYIVTQ